MPEMPSFSGPKQRVAQAVPATDTNLLGEAVAGHGFEQTHFFLDGELQTVP
jgi:hypothetical protein